MSHVATLGLEPAAIPARPTAIAPPFTRAYTRYAMGLLLAIYIVNFLDRQVVNILAEPIKNDLGLADWQLGLMSGLAFAVFYTFLGIPSPASPSAGTGRSSSAPSVGGLERLHRALRRGAELHPAGRLPHRRRRRRGRLHAAGPLADRRLRAQGEARLGARLLLHGHADRRPGGPDHGRAGRRRLRLARRLPGGRRAGPRCSRSWPSSP